MTAPCERRGYPLQAGAIGGLCLRADDRGEGPTRSGAIRASTLEWTIAFGPGGGNDIMSRTIVDILEKYDLYPEDIAVENRQGGSGAVGWGYLYSKAGSAYDISTTSGSFITTPLQADTPWGPDDFTPIALLATDDLVLLVNGNVRDRTRSRGSSRAAKEKPADHRRHRHGERRLHRGRRSCRRQAGFDFDYVSFNDAGEMNTALLSDALDAMMANPAEILGPGRVGRHAGRWPSAATRCPRALGDIPTMAEAGYEIGVSMPRGLILAPDAPKEAQEWWIETMKKVVETPEWDAYITNNQLTENIQYGDEFKSSLLSTQENFAKILREQGVIE